MLVHFFQPYYEVRMSPIFNKSTVLLSYFIKRGDAFEIHDRIVNDFCAGLPHTVDREIFVVENIRECTMQCI